jgi:thiol-disulfide isomerase/thioredoxin
MFIMSVLRSRILCLGALALLLCGASRGTETSEVTSAEAIERALIGSPAPRFVLNTIDGTTIDLGSLYGKQAVYLKFWATWCTPCREQMPHFEHTYETAGPDLAVIAINAGFDDPPDEILRFRSRFGLTMPIVRDDGRLGTAFRLRFTPLHVVIGRDGRIAYVGHKLDDGLQAALVAVRLPSAVRGAGGPAGAPTPADTPQFRVGDKLPDRSIRLLDGHAYRLLDAAAHRPTVLVFLSPWCESYLETTRPALSTLCKRVREQVDAVSANSSDRWLGIASGLWATPRDLLQYQADHKVSIPLTLDDSGALFRSFRVTNVPTILIADETGTITRRLELDETQGLTAALPPAGQTL